MNVYRYKAYQEEMVILRLCPEIFEDGLLPVALHVIPVVYHSMADGVVDTISGRFRVCKGLVADEEVEILNAALGCETAWFGGDRWGAGRLGGRTAGRYSCRKHTVWQNCASKCCDILDYYTHKDGSEFPAKLDVVEHGEQQH